MREEATGFAFSGALLGALLAAAALVAAPGPAAAAEGSVDADCSYNFDVTLRVRHQLAALRDSLGTSAPLEDVRVRISARVRAPGAWWVPWKTVRTDEDGGTDILIFQKSCRPAREYRIRVMFRSPELEIRQGNATRPGTRKVVWYTIDRGDLPTEHHTVSLDAEFAPGGARALGDREPRRHARIWSLYRETLDFMEEEYGSGLAFENKVKVKYPHTPDLAPQQRRSFANPTTKVVYLVRNRSGDAADEVLVMLHELMHIWAYQHSRGEGVLTSYFVFNGFETHGVVDDPAVAFHEGFAEHAAQVLMRDMLGRGAFPREPRTHTWLRGYGVTTAGEAYRADEGWESLFVLMAADDVWEYDLKAGADRAPRSVSLGSLARSCGLPRVSFEDLLWLFEKGVAGVNRTADDPDLRAKFVDSRFFLRDPLNFEQWEAHFVLVDPQVSQAEIVTALCGLPGVFEPPTERLVRTVLTGTP